MQVKIFRSSHYWGIISITVSPIAAETIFIANKGKHAETKLGTSTGQENNISTSSSLIYKMGAYRSLLKRIRIMAIFCRGISYADRALRLYAFS